MRSRNERKFTGLPVPTNVDKFWSRAEVKTPDECWDWKGAKSSSGYGTATFVWQGKSRNFLPHRVSVALSGRDIPDGMMVDHTCRNRMCVNPHHLRIVDPRTNCLENSESLPAKNVAKTHCHRGHSYDASDVRIGKDGARYCNACRRQKRLEDAAAQRVQNLEIRLAAAEELLEKAKALLTYGWTPDGNADHEWLEDLAKYREGKPRSEGLG